MRNFMILLKKNLIEMIRNKRIIIFSVVFSVLSIISALTAKFLPMLLEFLLTGMEDSTGFSGLILFDGTVADSYVQFISNFGEIALLVVGVLLVNSITKEKSKGTYDSLKMNGVKDKEIVLGHLVSQIILVSISYLISVAIFVVLNILLFRQIMGLRGLVALVYIYLLLIFMTCLSLFVSSISKKRVKAYLIIVLSYFVLGFIEMVPKFNKINPFHLLTLSSNLMYYENYLVSEHLITSLVSLLLSVLFVISSLIFVKNNINNKKVMNSDNKTGV